MSKADKKRRKGPEAKSSKERKKPYVLSKEVSDMLDSIDSKEETSPERPHFSIKLVQCDTDRSSDEYGEVGVFDSLDELKKWVSNDAAACFKNMADSEEEPHQNLLSEYRKEHPKKGKVPKKTA